MQFSALISGERPRSRLLAILLVVMFVALMLAPFLFPGTKSLSLAAKICYYVVLAASYDLLLGYTGIISFAHAMFFGIGGYGVAISLDRLGPGYGPLLLGIVAGLALTLVLAILIGVLSLRLRTIFFAMITLAVSHSVAVTVTQLYKLTGGEDGLTYRIPALFKSSTKFLDEPLFGVVVNGKLLLYYVVFLSCLIMFLLLLRVVSSPFGTVLKAIRENEFRAAAIGYSPVVYRTLASCLAAVFAASAGIVQALWLRYTGPETTMSLPIVIDILLIVVIGGLGSMYGAALGAAVVIIAQGYLRDLLLQFGDILGNGWLSNGLFNPDRWLLWLGLLFVLCVYFFPTGIVGYMRQLALMRNRN